MTRTRTVSVCLGVLVLSTALASCYRYRPLRPQTTSHDARGAAAVHLVNATPDTLDIEADGGARATLPPGAEGRLGPLAPGAVRLVARSRLADVAYRVELDLGEGDTGAWRIEPRQAKLQVDNPLDGEVEILVDGAAVGRAPASASAHIEAVAAGTRTLIARAVEGGYAVQLDQPLVAGETFRWVLPDRARGRLEEIPAGKGLIRLTNHSAYTVRVLVSDGQIIQVPPGERARIVVTPGAHELEAHVMGSRIASMHSVEVAADQVAEWDYGLEE